MGKMLAEWMSHRERERRVVRWSVVVIDDCSYPVLALFSFCLFPSGWALPLVEDPSILCRLAIWSPLKGNY